MNKGKNRERDETQGTKSFKVEMKPQVTSSNDVKVETILLTQQKPRTTTKTRKLVTFFKFTFQACE